MDLIETLYAWMTGTPPWRMAAAGLLAMLAVEAMKTRLRADDYKIAAVLVAIPISVGMEFAVASPLTGQSVVMAVLAGVAGGLIAPAIYEWAKGTGAFKLITSLVKRG